MIRFEIGENEAQARHIFREIDNAGPNDQIVRFMKAISLLYLDDPHIKVLRMSSLIYSTMPKTIEAYNRG